jgi:hypothetical protein
MIEFSITEIVLFCWAILATGYALRYRQEQRAANMFLRAILSNKDLREHMVADFEEEFRHGVE